MRCVKSRVASWPPMGRLLLRILLYGGADTGQGKVRTCSPRWGKRQSKSTSRVSSPRCWSATCTIWHLRDHATRHDSSRFDPWVVGASRRSPAVFEPRHKARVYRGQGWISPVLLVNGRMVGVCKHVRRGEQLLVQIEPFGRLAAWARAQLEAEAGRLAEFLGCDLTVEWAADSSSVSRDRAPRKWKPKALKSLVESFDSFCIHHQTGTSAHVGLAAPDGFPCHRPLRRLR